jgi:hypothetical protein
MKRLILFLTMILLPATGFAQSGKMGNLKWSLSGGTLTISGNGAMPDYDRKENPWLSYNESIHTVIINNSVTSIGKYAFSDCSSLTSATIPGSVTSIGTGAFNLCSNLSTINVDAANSHYLSEDGILFNRSKNSLIRYPPGKSDADYAIPHSVTRIEAHAFASNESLTSITIPGSVTSIGGAAFLQCSGLTSVTIPGSVTSIEEGIFVMCGNLSTINVDAANRNYLSENGILFNRSKSSLICYSAGKSNADYAIPHLVTSIGDHAFSGCLSLISVIIPESVTSIGNNAFFDCLSLTSVTLSDGVTSIGNGAFFHCGSLASIIIPGSVRSIGNLAFYFCLHLTSITIPGGVRSIGIGAFSTCSSLTDVSIEWATPLSISDNVFYKVPLNSATLHVPNGTKTLYEAADVWKDFKTIVERK